MFSFAENEFVPLIIPPESDTLTADSVKEDLRTKMKSTFAKVMLESIP